jgi:hypothetical protein
VRDPKKLSEEYPPDITSVTDLGAGREERTAAARPRPKLQRRLMTAARKGAGYIQSAGQCALVRD